jgi:two-component system phosphate regulon sensor histidine kinase PhoR
MTPTRRIGIILTGIFLIPALFFSVYEISSLSRDEKMIESIYQKQLEAILFSVNQYSDDAVTSWMGKLEAGLGADLTTNPKATENFLTLNASIALFFSVDSLNWDVQTKLFSLDSTLRDSLRFPLASVLYQNQAVIGQLIKYRKSGFQKLDALQDSLGLLGRFRALAFISGAKKASGNVCGFLLDPDSYTENIVGPRLQSIAQDQFTLSIWNKPNNARLYSTQTNDSVSLENQSLTKTFWIFPDHVLGIRTQGKSLESLVQERTNTNLILLIGLDLVLIIALILAFRSVRKEVQLAQNKADFVSNVSHEIRTPLALISMFAETLELGRAKSEEKKQEYYTIISKETQRLSGIVNKILSFSQMEAGKKTLHPHTLSLNQILEDVLRTYDFHLTSKGFEHHIEKSDPITITADKEALTEIIINLIDNAIKYSSERKRLEFSIRENGGMGCLSIRDFGVGISAADQKHIFDKFYRVSTGNLAKGQGTGLGLSLVKQLIEQLQGRISVRSELGRGSTFTISLPLSK